MAKTFIPRSYAPVGQTGSTRSPPTSPPPTDASTADARAQLGLADRREILQAKWRREGRVTELAGKKRAKDRLKERWPSHQKESGGSRSASLSAVLEREQAPTVGPGAGNEPTHRRRDSRGISGDVESPVESQTAAAFSSLLGTRKQRDRSSAINTLAAVVHGKSFPLRRTERLRSAETMTKHPTLKERAARMVNCCSVWVHVRASKAHPEQARPVPSNHCRDRMCPECNHARGAKIARRITPAIAEARSSSRIVAVLTLTQVDRPGEPLQSGRKRLNKAMARLIRSKAWKKHVAGALIFREATYNREKGSWHPHAHILLQMPDYWDREDIQALWLGFSPGAWNIDIRAATPGVEAELAKYGTKTVDFDAEQILEYAVTMAGARLVSGTGEWKSALTHDELEDPSEDLAEDEELYHLTDIIVRADAGDEWAGRVLKAVTDWICRKAEAPQSFPGPAP